MNWIRLFASCALCTLLLAAEALAQPAPPPPQITIDDRLDGNPVVQFGSGVSGGIALTDQFAESLSGTLSTNPASFSGTVVLSESQQDPFFFLGHFSDLLTLTVTHCEPAVTACQGASFHFVFKSDGAPNLEFEAENAIKNGATVIDETGSFQDLIGPAGALTYAGLDVQVRSDFADPQKEVPEPSNLALLGVALAGIGLARRRKLN